MKRHVRGFVAWMLLASSMVGNVLILPAAPALADAFGPTIDVWHADNPSPGAWTQTFALPGTPQPFINIVGNVSDPDGVTSLSYTLNGGASIPLTMGTGTSDLVDRRLAARGDFNVDLAISDLDGSAATDTVIITATDGATVPNVSVATVTVDYVAAPGAWPLPTTVTWPAPGPGVTANDVALVVDGEWILTADGARTTPSPDPGYDRLIALGDVTWDEYVVTAPITIHTLGDDGSEFPGGVGFLTGWQGHADIPVGIYSDGACGAPDGGFLGDPPFDGTNTFGEVSQPKCGLEPWGVLGWYRTNGELELLGDANVIYDSAPMTLAEGGTYVFKLRVQQAQTPGAGNIFSMKVWEAGTLEPAGWDIVGQEHLPDDGGLMLVAHHDDVTFGDVTVAPLSADRPVAGEDHGWVLADLGSGTIDVVANDERFLPGGLPIVPGTVTVLSEPSNGTTSVDPVTGEITYTHTAAGTTTDFFTYVIDDSADSPSNEAGVWVTIGPLAFDSDDFNSPGLSSRWTWSPAAAGTNALVGVGSGDARLAISVPVGTAHDKYNTNDAPRVMQDALDVDFIIEAKYSAEPSSNNNVQGLLVEQDAGRWMRFDVYHNGTDLYAFVGDTVGGVTSTFANQTIPVGDALYLRVVRTGDEFTFLHSPDGSTWSEVVTRTSVMTVDSVGAFAANPFGAGFTSELDYFFHAGAPIDPEDPVLALTDEVLLVEPNGRWHIRVPGDDDYTFFYGVPGDIPLFGDWDGDGISTPGAWRQGPGGGFAYMTNTLPADGGALAADFDFFFGDPGDEVFSGDWNNDGVDTLGINRAGHIFLTDTNGSGGLPVPTDYDFFFGAPGDRAFGGDGDGDGDDGVFLYRATDGFVYYTNSTPVGPGGVAPTADNFFFGIASDSFVAGDWNDDAIDSGGVFRGSNTTVYLTNTNGSGGGPVPTDDSYVWGSAGWTAVAGVTGLS